MPFYETKVYFDGSHYIAIPYKANPSVKKSAGIKDTEIDEKKEAFEKAYKGTKAKGRKKKIKEIEAEMKLHFESEEKAAEYVKAQMERKQRNLIVRRSRLARRINMGEWNYFCTFTYDDKKHTEESFKKKLQNCFKKMCYRKDWAYIGVWERSPDLSRYFIKYAFASPSRSLSRCSKSLLPKRSLK